jgi:general secretion pathway protein K
VRRNHRESGAILVAVLWTIALLAGLAMAASTTFRSFAGIMTVHGDRLRSDALLTAGMELGAGIVRRLQREDLPVRDVETRLPMPGGTVHLRLSDEGGKIDLGKAPPELLSSLFRALGAPNGEVFARRVVEWRDPQGSDPLNPQPVPIQDETRSPEEGKPAQAELPFSDVRQLANIPGIPPALAAAAVPFLTVFGNATVNVVTAPAEVIAALPGVDASRVRAVLDARARFPADAARVEAVLPSARPFIAAAPQRAISVEVTATLDDGFVAGVTAVIVVFLDDAEPYRILAWSPLGSGRGDQRTAK